MTRLLAHIPEVPLTETWEWLSNVLMSYDGSEQRISLRGGAPRFSISAKLVAVKKQDVRTIWNDFLLGRGEYWVPEFHILTNITQASTGVRIYFDISHTDIRVGEYLYLENNPAVYEVASMETDGCNLTTSVTTTVNQIVAPVHKAIVQGDLSRERYPVDDVAEFSFDGVFNKSRDSLSRPGDSDPLTYWDSVAVLDVRPLANSNPNDRVLEDNIVVDNEIGLIEIVNKWTESKLVMERQFIVQRYDLCNTDLSKNLDYWRHFLQWCRGSAKKFWLPLWRQDFPAVSNPPSASSYIDVESFDYSDLFFDKTETHLWVQITTEEGVHRCEVTGVGSVGLNTRLSISPSLPSGWVNVTRVELILPCRLNGDSVTWEHHHRHSILSVSFRSAENV